MCGNGFRPPVGYISEKLSHWQWLKKTYPASCRDNKARQPGLALGSAPREAAPLADCLCPAPAAQSSAPGFTCRPPAPFQLAPRGDPRHGRTGIPLRLPCGPCRPSLGCLLLVGTSRWLHNSAWRGVSTQAWQGLTDQRAGCPRPTGGPASARGESEPCSGSFAALLGA